MGAGLVGEQGAITLLEQVSVAEVIDCGGEPIGAMRHPSNRHRVESSRSSANKSNDF
jgi:hypothetical protein